MLRCLLHRRQRVNLRLDFLRRAAGPGDLDGIGLLGLAQADRHRQFRLREIASGRHHLPPERAATDGYLDLSADRVAVAFFRRIADELQAKPMVAELLIVSQNQRRAGDLG